MKKYLSILIMFVVALVAVPAIAQNFTIFDKDMKVQGYVRGGVVYDKNWKPQSTIDTDGRILNRQNQLTQGYIKDGRVYDSNWQPKGYIKEQGEPPAKEEKK